MKVLKRISVLMILCFVFLIGTVYAAEGKVELVKNFEKLKPGQTGLVELKLTSTEKPIVGIQMNVKSSENIEITGVTSGSDKWNLTAYNSGNGLVVLTNPSGAESGNIAKISIKAKEDTKAEEASISVENFEVSSNEYTYVTIKNVSTKISIEQPQQPEEPQEPEQPVEPDQPTEPDQPEEPEQPEEPQEPQEPQQPQQPEEPQEPEKPTNKPTNNTTNTPKPVNTNNKVDNTIIGGKIPHTGTENTIIFVIAIFVAVGTVCYIKYKRID